MQSKKKKNTATDSLDTLFKTSNLIKNLQKFVKHCRKKNQELLKYNENDVSGQLNFDDNAHSDLVSSRLAEIGPLHDESSEDEKKKDHSEFYEDARLKRAENDKKQEQGDEKIYQADSNASMYRNSESFSEALMHHKSISQTLDKLKSVDSVECTVRRDRKRNLTIVNKKKSDDLSGANIVANELLEDDLELQKLYNGLKYTSQKVNLLQKKKKKKKKEIGASSTMPSFGINKSKSMKSMKSMKSLKSLKSLKSVKSMKSMKSVKSMNLTKSLKSFNQSTVELKSDSIQLTSASETHDFSKQVSKMTNEIGLKRSATSFNSQKNNMDAFSPKHTKKFADKLVSFQKGFMGRMEKKNSGTTYNIGGMYMNREISEEDWSVRRYHSKKHMLSASRGLKSSKFLKSFFNTKGSISDYKQRLESLEGETLTSKKQKKGKIGADTGSGKGGVGGTTGGEGGSGSGLRLDMGSGTNKDNIISVINFLLDEYVPKLIGRYETCINKLDTDNKMLKQKIKESLDAGDVQYEEIQELKVQLVQTTDKNKKLTDTINMLREKIYDINELETKNAEYLDEIIVLKNKINFLQRALEETENTEDSTEVKKMRRHVKQLYKNMKSELKFINVLKAKYLKKKKKKKFSIHKWLHILTASSGSSQWAEDKHELYNQIKDSQKKKAIGFILEEDMCINNEDIKVTEESPEKEETEKGGEEDIKEDVTICDGVINETTQDETKIEEPVTENENINSDDKQVEIEVTEIDTLQEKDVCEKIENMDNEDSDTKKNIVDDGNTQVSEITDHDISITENTMEKSVKEKEEGESLKISIDANITHETHSILIERVKYEVEKKTVGTNTILSYDTFENLLNKAKEEKERATILRYLSQRPDTCRHCMSKSLFSTSKSKESDSNQTTTTVKDSIVKKNSDELHKSVDNNTNIVYPKLLKCNSSKGNHYTHELFISTLKTYNRKYMKLSKILDIHKKAIVHKKKKKSSSSNYCDSIRRTITNNLNCCFCPKHESISNVECANGYMEEEEEEEKEKEKEEKEKEEIKKKKKNAPAKYDPFYDTVIQIKKNNTYTTKCNTNNDINTNHIQTNDNVRDIIPKTAVKVNRHNNIDRWNTSNICCFNKNVLEESKSSRYVNKMHLDDERLQKLKCGAATLQGKDTETKILSGNAQMQNFNYNVDKILSTPKSQRSIINRDQRNSNDNNNNNNSDKNNSAFLLPSEQNPRRL